MLGCEKENPDLGLIHDQQTVSQSSSSQSQHTESLKQVFEYDGAFRMMQRRSEWGFQ